MQNVFVSIVNYNGNEDTRNCLISLNKLNIKNFKLNAVIIDNNSKIPFEKEDDYKNFKLEIVKSEKNLGFSGGQNLGIKYGLENGADFIIVLNNDVSLDKNLIPELLKTFEEEKDCGLVSPKIYFAKGHEFHKDRYKNEDLGKVIWYAGGNMDWQNIIGSHRGVDEVDNGQFDKTEKTDFISGCCIAIKKEVFESIGFFDEKYFLYYEDNDFSQRAKSKGFLSYYQPKAFMWHLNAGSTGGSGSTLQDYYITRNRLLFASKYASSRTKAALLKEGARLLINGRKSQKKGIKDFLLGKFGQGSF